MMILFFSRLNSLEMQHATQDIEAAFIKESKKIKLMLSKKQHLEGRKPCYLNVSVKPSTLKAWPDILLPAFEHRKRIMLETSSVVTKVLIEVPCTRPL